MQEKTENRNEQLSLLSFSPLTVAQDVLKRWYLILIAALLIGMAAYVLSDLLYTPAYTTTTTFVVSAKGSSTTVY